MKIIDSTKKYVRKIVHRKMNVISKFISFIIVSFLMFIPTYIFSFFWKFLSPETFWEKLAVITGGVFFLGWIQIIFLLTGLYMIFSIIFDN